ncbi:hypothetical protein [Oceanimonas doudoroffii]|uniref:Secreted protein n=1 Tax=Oceanimonas doudoroffii TaxID=84158 RepID=A0A233RHU0_9GAMM|nr:hypothetical protein [Oceanimonas doudoroffii]OXY82956.1 hypothetical protein B6S08_05485 [Oceanimonas doudoroffii]
MQTLTLTALTLSLALLAGCEPQGPAADVEDHIDEVVQAGFNTEPSPNLPAEARPEPEVIEQQKKQHQQVVEQASQEAENRLADILEATQPAG